MCKLVVLHVIEQGWVVLYVRVRVRVWKRFEFHWVKSESESESIFLVCVKGTDGGLFIDKDVRSVWL